MIATIEDEEKLIKAIREEISKTTTRIRRPH
jgi:hypothetical protein